MRRAGIAIAVVIILLVLYIDRASPPARPAPVPAADTETARSRRPTPGDPADPGPRAAPSLAGTVLSDEDRRPVGGVTVSALVAKDAPLAGGRTCVTGGDGRYEIRGLPPGPAVVWAHGDGWVSCGAPAASGAAIDGLLVEIPPTGTVLEDLVVTRAARTAGRVVDSVGHPVAGVPVVAVQWDEVSTTNRKEELLAETRLDSAVAVTGPDGRFAFAALSPGSASPSRRAPGRSPWHVEATVGADTERKRKSVEIPEDGDLTIDLREP